MNEIATIVPAAMPAAISIGPSGTVVTLPVDLPRARGMAATMPGILRRDTGAGLDLSILTLSAPLGQPFDHLRPDLALGLGTDGQPDVAG